MLKILLNFLLKILIFLSKFYLWKHVGHSWNEFFMSFGNLIKTLLSILWKLCNIVKRSFSERCLKILQDFPQLLKKMLKLSENLVWFFEKVMKTLFWKFVDKPCWDFWKFCSQTLSGFENFIRKPCLVFWDRC